MKHNNPSHGSAIMLHVELSWKEQRYTDVVLQADGLEIPCHKLVLAASSPYFEAMFRSPMSEARSKKYVSVSEVDKDALNSLVRYMYLGEIDIDVEIVQNLYEASDFLQMMSVKAMCAEFIKKNISVENCVGVNKFAKMHNEKEITSISSMFTTSNFNEVVQQEDFFRMGVAELIQYLTGAALCGNADNKLKTAVKWFEHDTNNREESFRQVVQKCIDIKLCSSHVLYDILTSKATFLKNERLMKFVLGAAFASDDTGTAKDSTLFIMQEHNVAYLKDDNASWGILSDIQFEGRKHAFYATETCLYAHAHLCDYLLMFNEKKWDDVGLPEKPREKMTGTMVCHNGKIYAIYNSKINRWVGDFREDDITKIYVHYLEMSSREWKQESCIEWAGFECSKAVSLGKHIYVFHGKKTKGFVYDSSKHLWRKIKNIPGLRLKASEIVALRDGIYFIGDKILLCYIPLDNSWTVFEPPPAGHIGAAAVAWKNKILLLGGKDGEEVGQSHISEFDPFLKKWTRSKLLLPWTEDKDHCNYATSGPYPSFTRPSDASVGQSSGNTSS